jgi:hypothetical protein
MESSLLSSTATFDRPLAIQLGVDDVTLSTPQGAGA